jgi:tRNA(fMet)-specific endonuclease VapC
VTYLLDTDTVTLLRVGHLTVSTRVLTSPVGTVGTSVVTLEESLSGWHTLIRKAKTRERAAQAYLELVRTAQFFGRIPVATYSTDAMAKYDSLKRANLNVAKNDLRIAAIALLIGAAVVTCNVRDFRRVPDLHVEDWSLPLDNCPQL